MLEEGLLSTYQAFVVVLSLCHAQVISTLVFNVHVTYYENRPEIFLCLSRIIKLTYRLTYFLLWNYLIVGQRIEQLVVLGLDRW